MKMYVKKLQAFMEPQRNPWMPIDVLVLMAYHRVYSSIFPQNEY